MGETASYLRVASRGKELSCVDQNVIAFSHEESSVILKVSRCEKIS
jgi:hypothetical protein